MIKLDDNFSIEKDPNNFILVEIVDSYVVKGRGKDQERIPGKQKRYTFYGTLAGALTGYLHGNINKAESVPEALKLAAAAIDTIDKMEKRIKATFTTEIKSVKYS